MVDVYVGCCSFNGRVRIENNFCEQDLRTDRPVQPYLLGLSENATLFSWHTKSSLQNHQLDRIYLAIII